MNEQIKPIKQMFDVPIFDARVRLVVAKDAFEARKKFDHIFGPTGIKETWAAMCSSDDRGDFGLFFDFDSFEPNTIAHEIHHLVRAIMSWCCAGNDEEISALLTGWLTGKIYKIGKI